VGGSFGRGADLHGESPDGPLGVKKQPFALDNCPPEGGTFRNYQKMPTLPYAQFIKPGRMIFVIEHPVIVKKNTNL
jgi:hypothetical protein